MKETSLQTSKGALVRMGFLAGLMALSGCETTEIKDRPLSSFPEWQAYRVCLSKQAHEYAPQSGSPLELGTIAASVCKSQLYTAVAAIAKVQGPYYAQGVEEASIKEDPKFVGAMILKLRG